jgi:PAS domain S-box-containing protein
VTYAGAAAASPRGADACPINTRADEQIPSEKRCVVGGEEFQRLLVTSSDKNRWRRYSVSRQNANTDLWDSLSPDLIGIQIEGEIVFINTAGAKLLGAASPEQVVGKPIMGFVHPDCQGVFADQVQQMTKEGAEVALSKEKWIRLDGTVIDVEVAAMPLTYQDKLAVQFIARHITSASK